VVKNVRYKLSDDKLGHQKHQTIILVILFRRILFCVKMSVFEPKKRYLWEVLLYFFSVKKSAFESHRSLIETYGEAALSETTCRNWLRYFKTSDFDVKDKERAGSPKLIEDTEFEALLDEDPYQRRTCRIIGSCSINHFHAFKSIGNDSKTRKLGTV